MGNENVNIKWGKIKKKKKETFNKLSLEHLCQVSARSRSRSSATMAFKSLRTIHTLMAHEICQGHMWVVRSHCSHVKVVWVTWIKVWSGVTSIGKGDVGVALEAAILLQILLKIEQNSKTTLSFQYLVFRELSHTMWPNYLPFGSLAIEWDRTGKMI